MEYSFSQLSNIAKSLRERYPISLDVNMKVIQRYLGHSNMSTTADIYSHLDANATGEAGMKLGKLLADDESEVS